MTPQQLEDRVEKLLDLYGEQREDFKHAQMTRFKQLLRDFAEAITPEKGYATAWTQDGDGQYETEFLKGRNQAIDTIQQNTNKLLGEKR